MAAIHSSCFDPLTDAPVQLRSRYERDSARCRKPHSAHPPRKPEVAEMAQVQPPVMREAKGGHITASKQSNDAPRKAMADVTNGSVNCNGKPTLAVEAKTCSRSSRSDVLRAAVMVIRQQQVHRSSHATGKGAAPGKVHSPRSQALADLSLGTAQLQEQAAHAAALALQHLLACDS
ncbi:hypothetical protein HaLaN_21215 [Haematococcus lacustris]|uniref:Uncharacterized protein n=1 Tax=Haematococcus lacustris TaxID=44745 RepID=A0A699ZY04_HAELA|nr:hypothetical protein HaLaN_21215 [Haematococcus lacustris]